MDNFCKYKYKVWDIEDSYSGIIQPYRMSGDDYERHYVKLVDTDLVVEIDGDLFDRLMSCAVGNGFSTDGYALTLPIGFSPSIIKYVMRVD